MQACNSTSRITALLSCSLSMHETRRECFGLWQLPQVSACMPLLAGHGESLCDFVSLKRWDFYQMKVHDTKWQLQFFLSDVLETDPTLFCSILFSDILWCLWGLHYTSWLPLAVLKYLWMKYRTSISVLNTRRPVSSHHNVHTACHCHGMLLNTARFGGRRDQELGCSQHGLLWKLKQDSLRCFAMIRTACFILAFACPWCW
jgi:hypothetical protein